MASMLTGSSSPRSQVLSKILNLTIIPLVVIDLFVQEVYGDSARGFAYVFAAGDQASRLPVISLDRGGERSCSFSITSERRLSRREPLQIHCPGGGLEQVCAAFRRREAL